MDVAYSNSYSNSNSGGRGPDANTELTTELIAALKNGDKDRAMEIVSSNSNEVSIIRDSDKILLFAAEFGHVELLKQLVDLGAEPDYRHPVRGLTALHYAAAAGHEDCIDLLLSLGAASTPDRKDLRPIHHAARHGQAGCVAALLRSHPPEDFTASDKYFGHNPLMLAAINGRTTCVKILLEYGEKHEFSDELERLRWLRNAAMAKRELGRCYQVGHNVIQDSEQSVHWLRIAAESGDACAQRLLGTLLYNDSACYSDAVRWFSAAANQNDKEAQAMLGQCHYHGHGVLKNYSKAIVLIQTAASRGQIIAQRMLGECFYHGHGVRKNHKTAVHWFEIAAEQGDSEAQYKLGKCLLSGKGIKPCVVNHTTDIKAVRLFRLSAAQGNAHARYRLGECYRTGRGVDGIDHTKAFRLFRSNAEQWAHGNSHMMLGICYAEGHGTEKDLEEAAFRFLQAEALGCKKLAFLARTLIPGQSRGSRIAFAEICAANESDQERRVRLLDLVFDMAPSSLSKKAADSERARLLSSCMQNVSQSLRAVVQPGFPGDKAKTMISNSVAAINVAIHPGFLQQRSPTVFQALRQDPTRLPFSNLRHSPDALTAFYRYIYADTAPFVSGVGPGSIIPLLDKLSVSDTAVLLDAAIEFQIPRLAALCEVSLRARVSFDDITEILELAMDENVFGPARERLFATLVPTAFDMLRKETDTSCFSELAENYGKFLVYLLQALYASQGRSSVEMPVVPDSTLLNDLHQMLCQNSGDMRLTTSYHRPANISTTNTTRSKRSTATTTSSTLESSNGHGQTKVFNAHTVILAARVPYFSTLFSGPFAADLIQRASVAVDSLPEIAISHFLRFIYCGLLGADMPFHTKLQISWHGARLQFNRSQPLPLDVALTLEASIPFFYMCDTAPDEMPIDAKVLLTRCTAIVLDQARKLESLWSVLSSAHTAGAHISAAAVAQLAVARFGYLDARPLFDESSELLSLACKQQVIAALQQQDRRRDSGAVSEDDDSDSIDLAFRHPLTKRPRFQ